MDLAAVGSIHTLPRQDFGGQWLQAGGLMSVRVADPVTTHLGARWGRIRAEGPPELGRAGTFLTAGQEAELDQWIAEAQARDLAFAVQSTAVTTRFAIDWRFDRRDSLVLQASATPWASGARSINGVPDEVAETGQAEEIETQIDSLPLNRRWPWSFQSLGQGRGCGGRAGARRLVPYQGNEHPRHYCLRLGNVVPPSVTRLPTAPSGRPGSRSGPPDCFGPESCGKRP